MSTWLPKLRVAEFDTALGPVVSDASLLISLAAVGLLPLLEAIYGVVLIPLAVRNEYQAGRRAAEPNLDGLTWISIADVASDMSLPATLDPGESAAIALAVQTRARAILLDERLGRRIARQLGLPVVGTLGGLLHAKQLGLIPEVTPIVDDLIAHGIRISPALRVLILRQAREDQ